MNKISWKINWRKIKLLPKSTGLSIAMLVAGFAEVLFLVLLLALDVLPFSYVALIILIFLLIAAVCVFGIDFAMPLIWPDYTRGKVLILGAMTLAAVSLLVFRFGRKEEKRRKEEASDECEEQDDYVVVSSMGKSFEMKVPARAKQHRDV